MTCNSHRRYTLPFHRFFLQTVVTVSGPNQDKALPIVPCKMDIRADIVMGQINPTRDVQYSRCMPYVTRDLQITTFNLFF